MSLNLQRALSLVVAAAYLITSLLVYQPLSLRGGIGIFLVKFLTILFPVACIWFGDDLDDYMSGFPAVTKASPAGWIRIGGWCLLALRLLVVFIFGY
jgi:hypothetical protein